VYLFPKGCDIQYRPGTAKEPRPEAFQVAVPAGGEIKDVDVTVRTTVALPPGSIQLIDGSSWGTFTIACTIPIALFVGLWMYRIRPGKVLEASLIGGALTLLATFLGGYVHNASWGHIFNLKDTSVIWAMAIYGFIASVLPVW